MKIWRRVACCSKATRSQARACACAPTTTHKHTHTRHAHALTHMREPTHMQLCDTYFFPTAKVISQTLLYRMLHVHYLSRYNVCNIYTYWLTVV